MMAAATIPNAKFTIDHMLAAFDRGVGLELVTLLSLRTTDANIAVLPTAQKSQRTKELNRLLGAGRHASRISLQDNR